MSDEEKNINQWFKSLESDEIQKLRDVYGFKKLTSELKELMYYKDQFETAWSNPIAKETNVKASVRSIHSNYRLIRFKNSSDHGKTQPKKTIEDIKKIINTLSTELQRVESGIRSMQETISQHT